MLLSHASQRYVARDEGALHRFASIPRAIVVLDPAVGVFRMREPIVVADQVTIIGHGSVIMGYGLLLKDVEGVWVTGLHVAAVKGDGMTIHGGGNHTIEFCRFRGASDGLLDINGGAGPIHVLDTDFEDGTPRGVLIGNWQKPEDPPEVVFMERCRFDRVPVRCPKIDGAQVFLKDLTVRNYRQFAVDIRAGSIVHIHRIHDLGGPKAHYPVEVEPGAQVEYL